MWELCWFRASVPRIAQALRRDFPSARVACFVFEIQVPPALAYAFEVAGITSVALQERLDATVEHHAPFIVNTVLSASPYYSRKVLSSFAAAVHTAVPVGLWRTDLFLTVPPLIDFPQLGAADDQPRKLVVALPYRVNDSIHSQADPVSMSASAMRSFLDSMIALAELRPDVFVVVRVKDDEWMALESLQSTIVTVERVQNMVIDRNYSTMNRSYHLCAASSLVIGTYTSLIDEALTQDIPCLLHDFTENASGLRRRIRPDYPASIVTLSRSELLDRASSILNDNGAEFRSEWMPTREDHFGALNDGCVRERSRGEIYRILGSAAPR
jgi:hypothetical protein